MCDPGLEEKMTHKDIIGMTETIGIRVILLIRWKYYINDTFPEFDDFTVVTEENNLVLRKQSLKCYVVKGHNETTVAKCLQWWIWVKGTQEFSVLFLQLFCEFEIIAK